MTKFKVGDKVKVIKSPYDAVRKGTITTVADIKHERYGKRWMVYILDTAFGGAFHEWELEKMNDKKE
jgi:transcription antitermination factor NusG